MTNTFELTGTWMGGRIQLHMPIVFLASGKLCDALDAVAAAERNCLVARALMGNVNVTVRARVETDRAYLNDMTGVEES